MNRVTRVYQLLLKHFGPQHWWPADTAFEVIVGAVLMPQTSWKNVEKAIDSLKGARMLEPAKIANASLRELTELVHPAGLHHTKPRRLRDLCRHVLKASGGNVDAFLGRDPTSLRRELLSLDGVGPETADSILLYAAQARVFVVDAYTKKVGKRVGLFDFEAYERIQEYFEKNLPEDTRLYQEYHALIVELAKQICRTRPRCDVCPLNRACRFATSRRLARA